jgi:thiol-disulfide isomerase/thioredoxin
VALLLSAVAVGGVLGYRHLQGSAAGDSAFSEVELMSLGGKGSVRLSDFRGGPLVVNFFASWCPACITELPTFERAAQDFRGRVAFFGVDEQDDAMAGLRLARDARVSYPLAQDTRDSRLFRLIHGTGMPTTVFLASNGSIRQVYSGELSGELLRQRLNGLFVT